MQREWKSGGEEEGGKEGFVGRRRKENRERKLSRGSMKEKMMMQCE